MKAFRLFGALLVLILITAGCNNTNTENATELRLGHFANITHAAAIAGVEKGILAEALGPDIRLTSSTFNAGPAAVEALLSGAIDAAYLGPSPAINAFSKSNGAVQIISGATSGGAGLVVKPEITSTAHLEHKRVASPQIGNTQDVALRTWLAENGFETTKHGTGDVQIVVQENAQTLRTFQAGEIDGAWVPEPWTTRLIEEGGGRLLVDERSLWPDGRFATTVLAVRAEFANTNPDIVKALLRGHLAATDYINSDTPGARDVVNTGIEKIALKRLPDDVIAHAWASLTFTTDPIATSLLTAAKHAERLGLLEEVDLDGITDLTLLNEVLRQDGRAEVVGV